MYRATCVVAVLWITRFPICCRSLVEEARAIALKAAQEQREKLLARAREAEAAKAAAEAAEAGAAASPAPELAAAAMTSVGAPQVCNLLGRIHVTPIKIPWHTGCISWPLQGEVGM